MRRKQSDDLVRKAKRARDTITEATTRLPNLLARDAETAGRDGYSAGGGGPGRSYDPRPTEAVALARAEHGEPPDAFHKKLMVLVAHLRAVSAASAAMSVSLAELDKMGEVRTQVGVGVCVVRACQAVACGVGEDRLKSGRCPRCYRWRLRHDGEDWSPRAEEQEREAC